MSTKRKDSKGRVLKECENQRKNGSYEFKFRDKKGNRHSIYGKTLEELRMLEEQVKKDILNGVEQSTNNSTINDFYERWVHIKRGLKENTFQNYKYMYMQYVYDDFGRNKLTGVKKSDIRCFYNYLREERHLQVTTIDTIQNVLHQIFDLAVEDEVIYRNPTDHALKELKRAHGDDGRKIKALTVEEQEMFEDFLNRSALYKHWQPLFTVMLWTGMRVGEAAGLRWCDIDLDKEIIDVNHTVVVYHHEEERAKKNINSTKTEAGKRLIPMTKRVKEAFIQEKEYQEEIGLKSVSTFGKFSDFIFVNRFGLVQHQGTVNKALRRIIRDCNYDEFDRCEKTGKEPRLLPHFSSHVLRHTFATRMCEANINPKAVQDILGHKDFETTMNIYTDATENLKRREILEFENKFSSLFNK